MLTNDQQLLISAFVDGEVTPDERVRAEQLLVEDAQARAFRETLLSMSADLKSLPEHRLPGDFAEQVLQAAEREMIVGKTWPGDPVEHSSSTRERWPRRVAYAAATIAAAVLVAIFVPRDNEPIAHKADQPAESAKENAAQDLEPGDAQFAASKGKLTDGAGVDADELDRSKRLGAFSQDSPESRLAKGGIRLSTGAESVPEDKKDGEVRRDKATGSSGLPMPQVARATAAPLKDAESLGRVAEPQLVVVSVDIGETAVLEKLLAANAIESHARGDRGGEKSKYAEGGAETRNRKNADELAERLASPTVYAEMTRSQLDQVVAQMKTDRQQFSAVATFGNTAALDARRMAFEADPKKRQETPTADPLAQNAVRPKPAAADLDALVSKVGQKQDRGKDKNEDRSADTRNAPPVDQFASPAPGGIGAGAGGAVVGAIERVRVLFVLRAPIQAKPSSAAERQPAEK